MVHNVEVRGRFVLRNVRMCSSFVDLMARSQAVHMASSLHPKTLRPFTPMTHTFFCFSFYAKNMAMHRSP